MHQRDGREKRLSRDDKRRFTIVRRPWMDIKKTMNVTIERVYDLLTKGTDDEIRRTRGRGLAGLVGGTNFRDISLTKLVIDVLFVRR